MLERIRKEMVVVYSGYYVVYASRENNEAGDPGEIRT
jgi:hypothetical protein